jgi:menaquinone-dependent protoporphyrinogen oxidase
MASVLVAYATKFGSTREVAERVASRLRERGTEVDLRAAREVKSVDGYDAVVFGGALYMFRLIREGRRFLSRQRKRLGHIPFAVFAMGPTESVEQHFLDARTHLDKTLVKMEGVTSVAVTIFGGLFDPARLRFPYANAGTRAMPAADLRDWKAIEAWADSLPEKLGLRGR